MLIMVVAILDVLKFVEHLLSSVLNDVNVLKKTFWKPGVKHDNTDCDICSFTIR